MNPAIVIPAFCRPQALARLLKSLEAAEIPPDTTLIISVDRAVEARHLPGNGAVIELVRHYRWPHGPLEAIFHDEHIGLVRNVFSCGELTQIYGAVILLEDDLVVSRRIYGYAQQSLAFYEAEECLAGISLNALWFNGFTLQPFIPLLDNGDVFFLQLSTPQGQIYTRAQWAAFAGWLASHEPLYPAGGAVGNEVHELFRAFPDDDWLAIKARYLVETGKYYCYPRESLTTCPGEPGTHFDRPTAIFRVPLQQYRSEFRFIPFDNAIAVYDGFYELNPDRLNRLTDQLRHMTYDIDLYASKTPRQLRAPYTLTTRRCRGAVQTFAKLMFPLEANVIDAVPGNGITLARREDVDTGHASTRSAKRDNDWYFARQMATDQRSRLGRAKERARQILRQ